MAILGGNIWLSGQVRPRCVGLIDSPLGRLVCFASQSLLLWSQVSLQLYPKPRHRLMSPRTPKNARPITIKDSMVQMAQCRVSLGVSTPNGQYPRRDRHPPPSILAQPMAAVSYARRIAVSSDTGTGIVVQMRGSTRLMSARDSSDGQHYGETAVGCPALLRFDFLFSLNHLFGTVQSYLLNDTESFEFR